MSTLDTILELIKQKGITQQAFLRDMGLDKSTISDWKRGSNQSYKKHIEKIADYFGVSIDYLLGRDTMTFTAPASQKKVAMVLERFDALSDEDKDKVIEYMEFLQLRRQKG